MISLDDFWRFINHRPGLAATAGEWSERIGAGEWDILRPRLFISDGTASSRVSCGRALKVVPMAGRKYGLVCETTGNLEHSGLTESDVRTYRLHVAALRTMVAEALGIIPDPQRIRDGTCALPTGTWAPVVGTSIPVFMMLPPTSARLASETTRLLAETDGCFVLLVPRAPKLDATLNTRLKQRRAMVVPLDAVVECSDSGQLSASPTWQTYSNAYCQQHLPEQLVPAPPRYEFRKTGDYWTIRFDGEFTTIKDAVGQAYIAQLLARPRRKIFAPDLLQAVTGESFAGQVSSAGAQADQRTLEDVKRRYLELHEELDEAERNKDSAAQERLRRELDSLANYLKTVKGFGGRLRQASDDADKIRRAMTQAIGRTIDSLRAEDKLPAAAQHLENAIKTGLSMSYEPEEELPWTL